jgi:hypothetical protein
MAGLRAMIATLVATLQLRNKRVVSGVMPESSAMLLARRCALFALVAQLSPHPVSPLVTLAMSANLRR